MKITASFKSADTKAETLNMELDASQLSMIINALEAYSISMKEFGDTFSEKDSYWKERAYDASRSILQLNHDMQRAYNDRTYDLRIPS